MSASQITFYKRPLPNSCTSWLSSRGKEIFSQALKEGGMENYFPLASQFLTQNEPAYCGLGTLCMILNALEVDPLRKWKGPWRWYEQEMLDCCRPLSAVAESGITLAEFACLARCNGLASSVTTPALPCTSEARELGIQKFREDVMRTSQAAGHMIAFSYSRKALGQTGEGHFSPIGGYSEKDDMLLVLDVARFKYPSYWISVSDAWDAMVPLDKETGQPRGYCVLSVLPEDDPSSVDSQMSWTALKLNKSSWSSLSSSLSRLLLSKDCRTWDLDKFLAEVTLLIESLPTHPVAWRARRPSNLENQSGDPPASAVLDALQPLLGHNRDSATKHDHTRNLFTRLLIVALFSDKSRSIPSGPLSVLIPMKARGDFDTYIKQLEETETSTLTGEIKVLNAQIKALGECCRKEEEAACGCKEVASSGGTIPMSE